MLTRKQAALAPIHAYTGPLARLHVLFAPAPIRPIAVVGHHRLADRRMLTAPTLALRTARASPQHVERSLP